MNILVVSHLFPSKIRPNNGLFVFQQVKALTELGQNVTVICPVPYIPKWIPVSIKRFQEFRDLPNYDIYEGINVYFKKSLILPFVFLRWRGTFYFLLHFLFYKKIIKNYNIDIIHSQVVFPGGEIGSWLKFFFKLPIVMTIHGSDFQIYIKNKKNLKRMRKIILSADRIVCVSGKLKRIYFEKIKNNDKFPQIDVIQNGLKVYDKYKKIKMPVEGSCINLLTIASLRKQKNIDLVFKAVSDLYTEFPNLIYYVVGDGWDRKYYEKKLNSLENRKNIFLLGKKEHFEAMSFLNAADIFILPSINESFGIVYIESMFLGKITIGTKDEGISEIIKNGENGFLIDPYDVDALKRLLKHIIVNFDKMQNIRDNAKRTVWPKNKWENNAEKYVKIYKELLG